MRSRDSAPNDSDSATVDLPLGLVDVGDTLSQVVRSGLLVVNTLNLEERLVRSGVSLSALVPEDSALDVESGSHLV